MEIKVLITLSIIVHCIFFLSVFDIYFTSPIIHGVRKIPQVIDPPASRLVLFVADGLRADKFFEVDEFNKTRSPFLRNILTQEGSWGVSHTRVPTESRPGHVAMIAGFYEDVSAIMKGWKENPVEFDSVFNESRNTWAFGSPDILPMFAKGSSSSRVHINCYPSDIESFAGDDSYLLDEWVFNEFSLFMKNAHNNSTLSQLLNQDKVVFFLHLLGIDTNGHSHKPWSKEYLDNIKKVDQGVQSVVKLLNDFYKNDGKTAYVFTSDHGMTDWGSHGAGLPSETLTPLVVWGAGAMKHDEKPTQFSQKALTTTRSWGLNPEMRNDINQADIAPLMSSLVGIPIPVNSVGVLPISLLSLDKQSKAKLMLTNAEQISEQYKMKLEIVKKSSFYFKSFDKLPLSKLTDMKRKILQLIVEEKPDAAINLSLSLIYLSLEGVQYYHTYHRTPLYFVVIVGFVGWMFLTGIVALNKISFLTDQVKKRNKSLNFIDQNISVSFFILNFIMLLILYLVHVPKFYYLYFLLPIPIWFYIILHRYILQVSFSILVRNRKFLSKFLVYVVYGLIGVWCLVFSFFYRYILSIELIIFALSIFFCNISQTTKLQWFIICSFSSIFPLLPVVGRESKALMVLIGGILGTLFSFTVDYYRKYYLTLLPLFCGTLAAATSLISSKQGHVPFPIHVLSWSMLFLSWFLPLCQPSKVLPRMFSIYLCHCAVYILISLSYDALFCVAFCVFLIVWIKVEMELFGFNQSDLKKLDFSNNQLSLDTIKETSFHTLRQSYILLFLFVFAFFGVGNIASINSFDVQIVLPFITVFQPFIMGGLLAYKVLLPYLLVVCTVCCVSIVTNTSLHQIFCFGLIISDIMGIHFFFMVKDYGSWLDIGESISHYVISMSMIMALLLFFAAAKFLTRCKFEKMILST